VVRKPLANAAGWLLPVLVALVATPHLLHALGAPRFGVWALCVLVASLLPTLDFGYGVAAVRDIARNQNALAQRALAAEVLTIGLVAAAIYAVLVVVARTLIARWLNFEEAVTAEEGSRLILLLAPWIALGCVNAALAAPARAKERFAALAVLGTISSASLWGFSVLLARGGAGLEALLVLGVAIQAAVAIVLCLMNRRITGHWPVPATRIATLTRSNHFAWASFANSATSLATYHADKALVSAFVGPAAAGLYTVVSNIANKLLGLIASLAAVVYPRVAAQHGSGDDASTARLYALASRIAMNVTLALATLGLVLADRFLRLWLGSVVTDELVLAFRLLIVAYVIASSAVVASNVLSGRGNARRGAVFAAAGGAITLTAGVLLIPRWGVAGAGVAALLGMSQAALFDAFVRRELKAAHPAVAAWGRPWLGWLMAAALAASAAWVVVHFVSGWGGFLLAAAAGVVAWAVVWFGLGFALPEERQIARQLLHGPMQRAGL
jgi:O-antigen/teichoic acid export membrane protein